LTVEGVLHGFTYPHVPGHEVAGKTTTLPATSHSNTHVNGGRMLLARQLFITVFIATS
jgi:D-arabinose 1-dehydrogenase-like Zn-dependent alcohol dehydrogenase